ncbi:MAG: glycosyltransferase, partial [Oscillospiraceae bacterium]|nr:glycosyltransferase [Candidatus Equicaccousia limihippi]
VIPFDKSVELLKTYYALLFPTYYDGEGFAGTLIDAMASGVPVVASDWKYNSEIIENRQTGAIFATQNQKEFIDTLDWVYKNTDEWNSYKINCIKRAKNYLPEIAVKVLTERLA